MNYVKFNEWERFKWHYNARIDRLCVTIITNVGEAVGQTLLGKLNLNEKAFGESYFTKDDIDCYYEFMQRLADLSFSYDEKSMIVFNAVATRRFHKEMKPVDPIFRTFSGGKPVEVGEVVLAFPEYTIKGSGTPKEADFLVVEVDYVNRNCYLMQISKDPIVIGETAKDKADISIKLGTCIRLSFDRVIRPSALNYELSKTLNIA